MVTVNTNTENLSCDREIVIRKIVSTSQQKSMMGEERVVIAQQALRNHYDFLLNIEQKQLSWFR